ncbi:MAG: hypothetical protein K0S04_3921, partial [Herbinix sp.]|nr:hypothetical protein [Herbinix sp.]
MLIRSDGKLTSKYSILACFMHEQSVVQENTTFILILYKMHKKILKKLNKCNIDYIYIWIYTGNTEQPI